MDKSIKTIYYRGSIKSCNYTCKYCPFSRKKSDKQQLDRDRDELTRFVKRIEVLSNGYFQNGQLVTIMFTPYGEAMIHSYYWEAFSYLSKLECVGEICCQTNLSFDIDKFVYLMKKDQGDLDKMTFWCSFHPSQVSFDNFMIQCRKLDESAINYSVGAVGDADNTDIIKELRKQLPSEI